MKGSIEIRKNSAGRVESGTIKAGQKRLSFANQWDDDGFLRSIVFDGKQADLPTAQEMYWFLNEKYIERIRRINRLDLIDLISEITRIVLIDEITTVGNMTLLNRITQLDKLNPDGLPSDNFEDGTLANWRTGGAVTTTFAPHTGTYCVELHIGDYIEQDTGLLAVDNLTELSIWARSHTGTANYFAALFTFSDAADALWNASPDETWIQFDYKGLLQAARAGKHITKVKFYNNSATTFLYVDDVIHTSSPTPAKTVINRVDTVTNIGSLSGTVDVSDRAARLAGIIDLNSYNVGLADGYSNTQKIFKDKDGNYMIPAVYPFMYNGVTWDRLRGSAAAGLLTDISDDAARDLGTVTVDGTLTQSTKHDAATYKSACVTLNANGNIIAGVASKVIKVHQIKFQALATMEVDVKDQDVGGAVKDHYKGQDREGDESPFIPYPGCHYQTVAGEPLYADFTTAASCFFKVVYTDADAS